MAALLARLEMENNALATDPKAAITSVSYPTTTTSPYHDRNISLGGQSLLSLQIPKEALGMSLGDFWAFVTRDYEQALAAMPTMTPIMIHKGVPDFLRPVVWGGIAGARQDSLYSDFDRLLAQVESEPPTSDTIIDKDVGRCFPSHPLFAQAGAEGQTMLGHVLKCYNLYDPEVGYCQGMGFIVGILLMKMDARDAFCVFVRLMHNHGLRDSYSQSLTGLHSRIFQFQELLTPIAPKLVAHLKNLGVEFAYLSQWFMTIFATTCPLETLFRVYDVVLAEGADETIMRVALALILKNEQKLLAMAELEDVLQLLLSREMWEPYENDPDLLIEEVTTLFKQVVTREALSKLAKQFTKQAERGSGDKTVRALGFTSTYGNAFKLFDFWSAPKSGSLSPSVALRRKASGQSLSTLNSMSGSGADSLASTDSYASTAPTDIDNDFGRDSATPTKPHRSFISQDRNLHEQVEGLLIALSQVQREAAQTAADLQREKARRIRGQEIVGDLLELFRERTSVKTTQRRQRRTTLPSRIGLEKTKEELTALKRQSNFVRSVTQSIIAGSGPGHDTDAGLHSSLLKLCALFDDEEDDDDEASLSEGLDGVNEEEVLSSQTPGTNDYTARLEAEVLTLRQRVAKDRTRRHLRKTFDLKDPAARNFLTANEAPSAESIRVRRSLYSRHHERSSSQDLPGSSSFPDITISVPRVRPHTDCMSPALSPSNARSGPPMRMIRSQDGIEVRAKPQKFGSSNTIKQVSSSSTSSASITSTPIDSGSSTPTPTPTTSTTRIPKRTSSLSYSSPQIISQTPASSFSQQQQKEAEEEEEENPSQDHQTNTTTTKHLNLHHLQQENSTLKQQVQQQSDQLQAMETLLLAQLDAHAEEMDRLKATIVSNAGGAGGANAASVGMGLGLGMQTRPDTPASMGPSPMGTPDMLAASSVVTAVVGVGNAAGVVGAKGANGGVVSGGTASGTTASGGGGWGWFGKVRTVSHSSTM
jgi:hypothetical protein